MPPRITPPRRTRLYKRVPMGLQYPKVEFYPCRFSLSDLFDPRPRPPTPCARLSALITGPYGSKEFESTVFAAIAILRGSVGASAPAAARSRRHRTLRRVVLARRIGSTSVARGVAGGAGGRPQLQGIFYLFKNASQSNVFPEPFRRPQSLSNAPKIFD